MKIDKDLLYRFKFFGIGLAIGLLILNFTLNKKKSKCTWFPNERVLKIIREKNIEYSAALQKQIATKTIDSTFINTILLEGNIDFSKSQTKNKPCRKYHIDYYSKDKNAILQVKICDSIASLSALKFR